MPLKVILAEALLAACLLLWGVRLWRATGIFNAEATAAQAAEVVSPHGALRTVAGINIWGKPVYLEPPAGTKRFVVFMLHGATISTDVAFWRSVAERLHGRRGIRLAGYCDGSACAEAARRLKAPAGFPILAFGEVIGSQALLSVDSEGDFFLLDGRSYILAEDRWRGPGVTPKSVAALIVK